MKLVSKRWERRNRHSNKELFNAYKSLEKMEYRVGRYLACDTDGVIIIKRIDCSWAFLPFSYKQWRQNNDQTF